MPVFKREYTLFSELDEKEMAGALERLLTKKTGKAGENNFQGKLEAGAHSFRLLPDFDYSYRNALRPEIRGNWQREKNSLRIEIKADLEKGIKNTMGVVLVFNLLFITGFWILSSFMKELSVNAREFRFFFTLGLPIALCFSVLIARFIYFEKLNRAIKILRYSLKAVE